MNAQIHSKAIGGLDGVVAAATRLRHQDLLPRLRATGCLFITSAVESIDDGVLARLAMGHTRADFVRAVALCREAGLTLSPTFGPFTPWTTPTKPVPKATSAGLLLAPLPPGNVDGSHAPVFD